jgi:hypothetical protein
MKWQHDETGRICEMDASPGPRWSLVKTPPTEAGWISVHERMPAEETPVLILLNDEIRIGELLFDDAAGPAYLFWDDPHNDGCAWDRNDVTHWMPLPVAPASAEGLQS